MKFFIDFNDYAPQADIDQYLSDNNCEVNRIFERLGRVYLVTTSIAPPDASIVERMSEDKSLNLSLGGITESVDVTEDNWWKIVSYENGEILTEDTTSIDIEIGEAHMDVYVVDSGIDKNHSEFMGQTINDLYTVSPDDFSDSRGHGTALASLITGNTCAITRANIQNVKVYHNDGTLTLSELLDALHAILEHSNSRPEILSVMNISWIMDYNEYVNHKIEYMISQGIITVVCAGNQGKPIADLTPACIPGVYTVGAYDQDFIPADFSNFTSPVGSAGGLVNTGALDIWAPGVGIRVADGNNGASDYVMVNGTSYSAAIFSACVCYNLSKLERLWSDTFGEPLQKLTASSQLEGLRRQKTGLLDLEPPHQECINKIATFMQNGNIAAKIYWQERKGFTTPEAHSSSVDKFMKMLFLDSDVQSYQITEGNLPADITITEGYLVGTLPPLPAGAAFELHKFTIECLSYDATETTLELSILHKNQEEIEDLTPEEIDNIDVEILLLLQGECEVGNTPPPCINNCPQPAGGFCFTSGTGKGICVC